MSTTLVTQTNLTDKKWYLIDAKGKILGRLAVEIANILRGRTKPSYTPHCDTGDYVVVINAEQVKVTGHKETDKTYASYSGFQRGLHVRSLEEIRAKKPEFIIMNAVRGMLPKNRLARQMLKKLRVCAGENHPYAAQSPVVLDK
jgi:large subunit ribosomal protein L13